MLIAKTFVLQWFWDGNFVTNLPRWFFFETMACLHHLLILDERFMTHDKNPLEILKCEHMKTLSGVTKISILVKVD